MIKRYYTYVLECSDSSLYIGYTVDLLNRIKNHNSKKGAKYTRGRTPVKLLYFEEFFEKADAMKKEAALKKLTRVQKLQYILDNENEQKYQTIEKINKLKGK